MSTPQKSVYTYQEIQEMLISQFPHIKGIAGHAYQSDSEEQFIAGFNEKGEGAFAILNYNKASRTRESAIVFTFKNDSHNYTLCNAAVYGMEDEPNATSCQVRDKELRSALFQCLIHAQDVKIAAAELQVCTKVKKGQPVDMAFKVPAGQVEFNTGLFQGWKDLNGVLRNYTKKLESERAVRLAGQETKGNNPTTPTK